MNPNEGVNAFLQGCDCGEMGEFSAICSFNLEWTRIVLKMGGNTVWQEETGSSSS